MKILSCECNMDTACVELNFADGSMIAIDTISVENEVADNMHERSELANISCAIVGWGKKTDNIIIPNSEFINVGEDFSSVAYKSKISLVTVDRGWYNTL